MNKVTFEIKLKFVDQALIQEIFVRFRSLINLAVIYDSLMG